MKKIVAALIAVSALLTLGGCSESAPDEGKPDTGVQVANDDYAQLVEVDGIRCVVVTGFRSTAVSCDWED